MVTESNDRRLNTDAKMEDDDVTRLPHERDESPDARDKAPRGVIKQAAEDLAQGLVDTDLRGTPGVEQAVPRPAEPGQARPQPDAARGMREHDSTVPSRGHKP